MAGDVKHGMRYSSENTIWRSMVQRCHNPKNSMYRYYGGRGIVVCKEWLESFMNFYRDVGPRPSALHTIDRTDNNGPYSPENCKWKLMSEQSRNKRNSRMLEFNGKIKPMCDWAQELGIKKVTLSTRINTYHWPVIRALTEPVGRRAMPAKEMTKSP